MGINIGTQLLAPEGYLQLEKGVIYYFLKSDAELKRALLVRFIDRPSRKVKANEGKTKYVTPQPFPVLVSMPRDHFETGVSKELIVAAEVQSTMPPWLAPLEGKNLSLIEKHRKKAKHIHSDRIDAKLKHIQPSIKNAQAILSLENPDTELNRQARACVPKQNETKFRLGFYAYLVFGCNINALHYPVHRIGHWDRKSQPRAKLGAPSPYKGKHHGCNVDTEMSRKIKKGYDEYGKPGVPLTTVYENTMRRVFGCTVVKNARGYKEYNHPKGKHFPTMNQFRDHIEKLIGKNHVRRKRIGKNRHRHENLPSQGKYTESISNLLQKAAADGFYFEELPKGYVDGGPLPPLCMVRVRDYGCGGIFGIGFALKAERGSAYRMAYFCGAIDKVKYCSLFGITIEPHQWPMIGLPPFLVLDRGPGSSLKALAEDIEFKPAFRELAPSYSGQSRAVIESSHPKSISNKDAPSHWQSNLTPVEMVRREIYRVLRDNDSMDMSGRITPDLVDHLTQVTPNGLWNTLDKLGRNDGYHMCFADAVRNFLTQVSVKGKHDGIYLHGQRYDSAALRATSVLDRIATGQSISIQAYVLEACVRHIWIEEEGEIIELDLHLPLAVGSEVHYVSIDQLKQMEQILNAHKAAMPEHRRASSSSASNDFYENAGKEWDSGSRRGGKPKRNTQKARQEAQEAVDIMRGRDLDEIV